MDASEWLLEGSSWRELDESGPGSELPGGAQGAGQPSVKVSRRQRKGEGHRHHRDRKEEEEDGGEEEQPFLTTAEL